QTGAAWLTTTGTTSWQRTSLPTWVTGNTYVVNASATDVAGNIGTADSNSFTYDDAAPSVSNVLITDTTINSTLYVKDGDTVNVSATVTDAGLSAGDTNYIKANLSGFYGGSGHTADIATGYNGTVAWWIISGVTCSPSDGTVTVTINASDPAGNYNNTESDTITADNTAPTFNYAVFSPDYNGNTYSYIDVYFSENVDNSTISTTDFSIGVSGVTVTAFYNDGDTNKVTLKLSHKITGGGPTITISGDGVDDLAGNAMSSGTVTINTYRITLSQGWNLISIPADVSSISIRTLLDSIWSNINMSCNILWYNASSDSWLSYNPSQQTGSLSSIEPGKAYWIKMNATDTLVGNYYIFPHGTSPTPIVELTGHRWNMIGHWVVYNQTADTSGGLSSLSDVLASSGEILYKYDTTTGAFVNVYGSSTTNMEPGVGYWLWLKTTQTGYYTVGEQG
ncbi:MAG: hypothetical protein J7L32_02205, partial [Thermoplasmata archaeon]|nr:hypothetical protein [Thermoplasmata archaeon]